MAEYISREALLAEIAADYGNWIACNDTDESYRQGVTDNYSDTIRLINDIPAADVQPVKRGRWQTIMMSEATGWDLSLTGGRDEVCEHICSCCHKCPVYDEEGEPWFSDYCPHCGARMDLKEE